VETIRTAWDFVMNLDVHLAELITQMNGWVYVILFLVIFAETGVVVAPWLPGESLLLTAGTLAGTGLLDIAILTPVFMVASFLGDFSNYMIGRLLGKRLLSKPRRWLKPEHVVKAHEFYDRHGGKAIVFARYLPVVRTLAPFVAGVTRMSIRRFLLFDAIASVSWVTIFMGAGYWFGTVPWVKDNLAFMLVGVVLASMLPGFIVYLVRRFRKPRAKTEAEGESE